MAHDRRMDWPLVAFILTGTLFLAFFVYHLAVTVTGRATRNPHELTEAAYCAHIRPKDH